MKNPRLLGAACLLLPIAQPAAAADQYLCVADKATGFYFENGAWDTANFKTNGKFIIRKPTKEEAEDPPAALARDFVVSKLGDKKPSLWCNESFYCRGFADELIFRKESLRFLYIYQIGYVSGKDDNADTPSMQIGTCSPL